MSGGMVDTCLSNVKSRCPLPSSRPRQVQAAGSDHPAPQDPKEFQANQEVLEQQDPPAPQAPSERQERSAQQDQPAQRALSEQQDPPVSQDQPAQQDQSEQQGPPAPHAS